MTELERWMNDHPPLADALTAEETAALRQKVLARRPKPRVLRGWRLAAAAAALCLVAAGAVVLGLFHPMSAANETNALVQKYGEVLDEPLTAEINGHTVSVKALLRDKNTLRVLYDVDHAQGLEPWDLVWSTANFTFIPTEESALDKRMYTVTNFGTGLCGGYAVGSFETRNATSESGILSGVVLAIGRIVGETAALLFTAGTVADMPKHFLLSSGRTLAVHMYQLSLEGLHYAQAYATGVVLLLLVLGLNSLSSLISRKIGGKAS